MSHKIEVLLAITICLAAACLPFPITVSWAVLIVSIVVWIIWKISAAIEQREFSIEFGPIALPLILYVLAVTASGAPMNSAREIFQSVASLRVCFVYFFAYDVFARFPKLKPVASACLLFVSALSGIWGSIQQIFDWHPMGFKWLQGTGFQSGPMAFAGQMQIFSLFALGFFLTGGYRSMPKPFQSKMFFGFICAANVAGVVFASERSAWLGFLVSSTLFCFLLSRKLMLRGLLVSLGSLIFAWFCVPVVKKRMLPLLDWQHEVSSKARFEVWNVAYKIFQEHPIFGIGATKFPKLSMKDAIVPGRSEFLDHAHSNYFQILSTSGVLGFAAYLYLCLSMVFAGIQHLHFDYKQNFYFNNVDRAIGLSVIGMVVSLMVSGIFEYNFGTGPVRLPEFFVLALLSSQSALGKAFHTEAQ